METLVCVGSSPLHLKKPSNLVLLFNTKHITFSTTQRTLKLHAQAKGFGGESVTVPENKRNERDGVKNTGNINGSGDDDDKDSIPEVIFERMLVRILFFVGSPMATGLVLLQVFDKLKEQQIWDVPLWLPFLIATLAFGTSGVGLAYGTLSTNWDPEKKGSLLGWEEAQQNWPELWKEDEKNQR